MNTCLARLARVSACLVLVGACGGEKGEHGPKGIAATPSFAPGGPLNFRDTLEVTLATATPGATIHYTTDGNPPTASSPAYVGPITLSATTTLRAIAVARGMDDSAAAEESYTRRAVDLVLDDGTLNSGVGLGGAPGMAGMLCNRFTPPADALPFELRTVSILFREYDVVGTSFQIVVYTDANGDPTDGAVVETSWYATVQHADDASWSTYALPEPFLVREPGDLVVGILAAEPSVAMDHSSLPHRSLGFRWYDLGYAPALPADEVIDFGESGSFMIRGSN